MRTDLAAAFVALGVVVACGAPQRPSGPGEAAQAPGTLGLSSYEPSASPRGSASAGAGQAGQAAGAGQAAAAQAAGAPGVEPAAFDTWVDRELKGLPSAVIAVVDRGGLRWHRGVGSRDARGGPAPDRGTVYRIGSITKV
ncbi:MAG TPA: serine hydrolase, partial [Kofleriaceae bacterium]|nr:serine hydrolase [Kofleriaceae bacterium]